MNHVAKKNGKDLILIDLSRSEFVKYENYNITFNKLFKFKGMKSRLFTIFLFVFSSYFSIKTAQVSLDFFTTSHFRGIIMNLATASADLSLIFTQLRISVKYLFMIDLGMYCVVILILNLINPSD